MNDVPLIPRQRLTAPLIGPNGPTGARIGRIVRPLFGLEGAAGFADAFPASTGVETFESTGSWTGTVPTPVNVPDFDLAESTFLETFESYTGTQYNIASVGSRSDSALTHTSLTNPLTGQGTTGRTWFATANGGASGSAMITTSHASGAFSLGTATSKAVSVRAWLRTYRVSAGSGVSIGLSPKGRSIASFAGVNLMLGDCINNASGIATHGVYLAGRTTAGATISWEPDQLLYAHPQESWINLRIDVTPHGNGGDHVQCYYRLSAGDSWTSIFDSYISPLSGFYTAWSSNRIGWFWYTPGTPAANQQRGHIDAFEVRIKAI